MTPEIIRKESNMNNLSIVSEDLEDSKVFTSVYDSFVSSDNEDSISSKSSSSVSKSVDPQEAQEEQKEEVKMHDEYEFTVNNEKLLNLKAPETIKHSTKNVLETQFRRVKMHKSSEIKLALYEDLKEPESNEMDFC